MFSAAGAFRSSYDALLQWFYPDCCLHCSVAVNDSPVMLCPACFCDLRSTGHFAVPGNAAEKLFWGRVKLERAAALFYMGKHSALRPVLHELKYRNKPEIGRALGRYAAIELSKSIPVFPKPDLLIPIPLHPDKLKKRGYNQSEQIAEGMAEELGAACLPRVMIRTRATETQTRKNREQRLDNVDRVFGVLSPELLAGKRVLLVDDVITTGATIESAALELNSIPGIKVSVFALAMADQG